MSGIFDIVKQQLTPDRLQQIAEHSGVDPAVANQAVTAAVPMILGGMAKHASQPGNAEVIHAEAEKHANSAGVLGDLPAVFTGSGDGGLIGKIAGQHKTQIEDGVAKTAGIDKAKAGRIVAALAPVVLGAIALKKKRDGLQPAEVSSSLRRAQQDAQTHAETQSPQLGGVLGSVMGQIFNRDGPRA
jgi:hypothetical protein